MLPYAFSETPAQPFNALPSSLTPWAVTQGAAAVWKGGSHTVVVPAFCETEAAVMEPAVIAGLDGAT
ncbi:hypothetical protein ACVWZD_005971 [Streptomyces sp. TE3672]